MCSANLFTILEEKCIQRLESKLLKHSYLSAYLSTYLVDELFTFLVSQFPEASLHPKETLYLSPNIAGSTKTPP